MTMKNGFSTINRLLGKHRESSGNLSRSSTNLSVTKSNVNIHESSQELHQNRITPLPIATSNAPFEQTFRITVLLPRDQLYVARLGARVLLHKLLQLVCENKQLDPDKYEFQHPADPSQIFSCDLTIGAVGLSEIRLCNKSEYNNANRAHDDVTYRRNSFSSSKFSIMNSKNISNTPSLYSSRNSLNSMSSSGVDSNFRNNNNITPEVGATKYLAPVIPARKKRLAPRPPSQNLSLIENDAALRTKTSELPSNIETADRQHSVISLNNEEPNRGQRLEERISDRNDLNKSNLSIDCNGNTKGSNGHCIAQCQETSSVGAVVSRSHDVVSKETASSHNTIEIVSTFNQPEPSPRRKVQPVPRKPVPVAPPRSITISPTENINETQFDEKVSRDLTTTMATLQVSPVAIPRSASSGSLISQPIEQLPVKSENVSEIVVNKSPTVESSLLSQIPDVRTTPVENINLQSKVAVLDDAEEQTHQSWNSTSTQSSETKHKSFIESSSEDDEMIKVYDLKLGKTIVKTLSNHKTSEVTDGTMSNVETNQTTSHPEENFVKFPKLAEYSSEKDVSVAGEIRKDDIPDITSSILEHQPVVSVVESPEPHVPSSKDEKQDNPIKLNQELQQQRITDEFNIKPENHSELKQFVAEKAITEEETKEVKTIDIINSEKPPQKPPLNLPQKETTSSETIQLIEEPDEKQKPALEHPQKDTTSSEIEQLIEDPDEKTPVKQPQKDTSSEVKKLMDDPDEKQKPLLNQPQNETTSLEIKQLIEDLGEKQKSPLKQPQNETTPSETKQLIEYPHEKRDSGVISATKTNSSTQETFKQEPLISTLERLVGDEELLDDDVDEQQHSMSSPIQTKPAIQAKPAIQTKPALATRSSSFLSLVQLESNNQRNYPTTDEYFSRRRRSSSELSIGESPSLQSFGVIKSILNSRQNSTEESNNNNNNRSPPPTECDIQSMEEPSPKSNNILKTNTLKQGEKEKVYRYSGPPNIHFSTWSDRPKVQVLIKNEQDCIFNGSKNGSVQNTTNTVNKGNLAVLRNNSGHVLGDLRKGSSTEKGSLRETTSSYLSEKEMAKPQNPSPTSTRPKFLVGARTSMQWPITSATSNTSSHNNRPLSQPLMRSTSITRITSNPVIEQQTQPAFGQGTLRKTGFKEKIVPLQNNDNDVDVTKSIPFTFKNQIQNQTNPQTTPKITKTSLRTVTQVSMVPDAPPPPPIIRAVVTKQNINNNNRTQISLTVDPRDQLLSAIRNFKRDELKNGNI